MSLQSKTNLEAYTIGTTAEFMAALVQVAGYDSITVTTTTQDLSVSTRQTIAVSSAVSCLAKLPAGSFPGQQKVVSFTLSSAGHTLILTPAAGVTWKQADGTTNVASITFDANNEYLVVKWDGAKWVNEPTSATIA